MLQKTLVSSLLILAVVSAVSAPAAATETDWRWKIAAGGSAGADAYCAVGTATGATDDVGSEDHLWSLPLPAPTGAFVLCVSNDGRLLDSDIRAPITAGATKVWDLRVGCFSACTYDSINLSWFTLTSTVLPPGSIGGITYRHVLVMYNNRGQPGAPANGTSWEIPVPAEHSTNPVWSLTLPPMRVSGDNAGMIISQAYVMEFRVEPVPEPASLATLATGLFGAGLIFRRKDR